MHSLSVQFKRPIANFVNESMVMTNNEQTDLTRANDVQHRMSDLSLCDRVYYQKYDQVGLFRAIYAHRSRILQQLSARNGRFNCSIML